MIRYSKLISTGQILQTMSGGDDNRPAGMNDENWEALKLTRLNTLKTNAIASGYPESDIAVGWMEAEALEAIYNPQIEARKIADKTPLEIWEEEIAMLDEDMPRDLENIVNALDAETYSRLDAVTRNKAISKAAKREMRPA